MVDLRLGDCLEVLRGMPDHSVDSLVCDPPCGVSFMGLQWDKNKGGRDQWVAWLTEILSECRRVMRPGAIGAVWSLPRTQHWTAWACEDAGFRIWDNLGVAHVFGSGFPKGHAIDKLIDARLGKSGEREVVGTKIGKGGENINQLARIGKGDLSDAKGCGAYGQGARQVNIEIPITAPATPEAQSWEGWRTPAIKPGFEFWVLIQAPPDGSIVENVLRHGVGGVNIDATRVPVDGDDPNHRNTPDSDSGKKSIFSVGGVHYGLNTQGRYPANFAMIHHPDCDDDRCHADCPIEEMGRQSGWNASKMCRTEIKGNSAFLSVGGMASGGHSGDHNPSNTHTDTGTAARYFHQFRYEGKASPRDRSELCRDLLWRRDKDSSIGWTQVSREEYDATPDRDRATGNIHATVKNTALMDFLVTLTTPPGGVVLDPFMGSGSTGVAAVRKGFGFIGIEQEPGYLAIAQARIETAKTQPAPKPKAKRTPKPKVPNLEQRVESLEFQQRGLSAKVRRIEAAGQLSLFG